METKARQAFNYDHEKTALQKQSNALESNIENDLEKIKEYAAEYGRNALIIGGSLLGTYLLLTLLTKGSGSKTKHKKDEYVQAGNQPVIHYVSQKEESPIIKQIKSSITLFLISLAKQKLNDFLASQAAKNQGE